jgi:hypothetical protein
MDIKGFSGWRAGSSDPTDPSGPGVSSPANHTAIYPTNGVVAYRAHFDRLGFFCVFSPTKDQNFKNSKGLIGDL